MCLRNNTSKKKKKRKNTSRKAYWLHSLLSDGPKIREIIVNSFIPLFLSFNPLQTPKLSPRECFLLSHLATHTSPVLEGSPCPSLLFLCWHFLHKTFGSHFSQTVFIISFPGSVSTIYSPLHTHTLHFVSPTINSLTQINSSALFHAFI